MNTEHRTTSPSLPLCRVQLDPTGPGFACLNPLLRAGVGIPVPGSLPVRTLLCGVLGLNPEFVEQRVATLFLNSHPVDDLDTTRVRPGDTVALAAAMPGIAGITMRRNSPVKALRADISCNQTTDGGHSQAGSVTVKLFNFIALEAGPGLLALGVVVPARLAAQTLAGLGSGLRAVELDGKPSGAAALEALEGDIRLVAAMD